MASFYVEQIGDDKYQLWPPKQGRAYFRLVLRVELADLEGGKSAVRDARNKNSQISFPDLLKVFASLHGTYSQPPGKRIGLL